MRRAADPLADADAAALAKRARHQRWHWCRLENDFFDNPIWRVVSELTGAPLFQVQAFVGRLECLANKSEPRGYVGDFRAVEFGAALGMPAEHAARIFAALEHVDVAWVDQDHVATFDGRNPDRPDVTAPERDRRRKARQQVRKYIDKRFERGDIVQEQRDAAAAMLGVLDDRELFNLRDKLRAGVALEAALSTSQGHGVAYRDSVAGHARADQTRSENSTAAVDNSGDGTRGTTQGLPQQEGSTPQQLTTDAAELWLAGEGLRILVERFNERRPRAETLIARWRRDLEDDPVAVATLIAGFGESTLSMARLEQLVADHIRRSAEARLKGERLPLPPVRAFGTDPLKSTAPIGHAVAPRVVDNAAPANEQRQRGDGTNG